MQENDNLNKKDQTVSDLDEQVTADDMKDLLAGIPGAAVSVVKSETEVVNKVVNKEPEVVEEQEEIGDPTITTPFTSDGNKEESAAPMIGAATPADHEVTLSDAVSGEKEMQAKVQAHHDHVWIYPEGENYRKCECGYAENIVETKPAAILHYEDPLIEYRDEKGRLRGGIAQDTNKNGTVGRPAVIDEMILHKLKTAFLMGCTDLEACQLAGIGKSTLYNYQDAHPEFVEEKELWKQNPILKARSTVYMSMGFDPDLAFKFLERKKKDEFALRVENTGKDGESIEVTLNKLESNYDELAANAAAALESAGSPGEAKK